MPGYPAGVAWNAPLLNQPLPRFLLAPRLGRHEMPQALERRAALPKTSVAKPSRKALLEREDGAS